MLEDTFKEVTLEELLNLEDCSLVSNSEDGVWQYYFVKTNDIPYDGYIVKIKYEVVKRYLNEKDKQKMCGVDTSFIF